MLPNPPLHPTADLAEEREGLAVKRAEMARTARGAKTDPAQAAQLQQLRTDYAASKLELYIRETVAKAPELSVAQRERLSLLLSSGGSDAA